MKYLLNIYFYTQYSKCEGCCKKCDWDDHYRSEDNHTSQAYRNRVLGIFNYFVLQEFHILLEFLPLY